MNEPQEDWTAAQFADEAQRLRGILESLEAAEKAGVPQEHVINLASECGAATAYQQWRNGK